MKRARRTRLTKGRVQRLSYSGKQYKAGVWQRCILWDVEVPGFGVRVTPEGERMFVFSFRSGTRSRLYTIGNVKAWTVDDARKEARDLTQRVDKGEDPLNERKRARERITVKKLCEKYLEDAREREKGSVATDVARLNKHVIPRWGSQFVEEIMDDDVKSLHKRLSKKTPVEANRVLSLVGTVFEFAKAEKYLREDLPNPARRIKKNQEKERKTTVSKVEMPRLVEAIEGESNPYIKGVLWLYLLTGCRKNELLKARWEDVDLEARTLTLPETKNGETHVVPLSPMAVQILQGLPRLEGNPHVFPGRKRGGRLVNVDKRWRILRKKAKMEHITLHDLRRTVGSMMAESGRSLHLIGKVLNHRTSEVTKRYAQVGIDVERGMLEAHEKDLLRKAGVSKPGEIVDLQEVKEARGK